ncbi:hypothetical protein PFISCL1PPCAC_28733, partial [Pristionchus fissidentatus]
LFLPIVGELLDTVGLHRRSEDTVDLSVVGRIVVLEVVDDRQTLGVFGRAASEEFIDGGRETAALLVLTDLVHVLHILPRQIARGDLDLN